mgnify:CR=1 FL=1|tara:strand:+ start:218 stop:718 length:501 start_codon:yes stop_codon:yes gene_type:complete
MIPQGYKFFTAKFIDVEKTQIETLWVNPDKEEHCIAEIIEMDPEHGDYQKLMEHTTLDDIHEMTVNAIRTERKLYEESMLAIAKREGIISDMITSENSVFQIVANTLFQPYDPDTQGEQLFSFKLTLFEHETLKNCKDRALKAKLRKAENFIDAVKVAIEIAESSK